MRDGVDNGRARPPRVLVAEDERDVAELIRHHLTKDGYEAVIVRTGTEALTKPFSPRELLARIRAVARRRQGGEATAKRRHLKAGPLAIDRERFEVTVGGRAVGLTPKEFELLATLVGAPGRVFRRDELLDLVWGRDGFVEPRTVDVHMARLRAKFLDAKVDLPGVETVRGVGYRFREAV